MMTMLTITAAEPAPAMSTMRIEQQQRIDQFNIKEKKRTICFVPLEFDGPLVVGDVPLVVGVAPFSSQ